MTDSSDVRVECPECRSRHHHDDILTEADLNQYAICDEKEMCAECGAIVVFDCVPCSD